jgi:hypothetical protein
MKVCRSAAIHQSAVASSQLAIVHCCSYSLDNARVRASAGSLNGIILIQCLRPRAGKVCCMLAGWRSVKLHMRDAFAALWTSSCEECSKPIRWWSRRVWVIESERCAHFKCWNERLFLHSYVQLVSEEARQCHRPHSPDPISTDTELRELRAFARTVGERVQRLEEQLHQAQRY